MSVRVVFVPVGERSQGIGQMGEEGGRRELSREWVEKSLRGQFLQSTAKAR